MVPSWPADPPSAERGSWSAGQPVTSGCSDRRSGPGQRLDPVGLISRSLPMHASGAAQRVFLGTVANNSPLPAGWSSGCGRLGQRRLRSFSALDVDIDAPAADSLLAG